MSSIIQPLPVEIAPAPPPKLGVGFTFMHGWEERFAELSPLIDFHELSPDVLCQESAAGDTRRRALRFHPAALEAALGRLADRPVVVHGLNLSIGTAGGWNQEYVAMLDELAQRRSFAWHSEHLGFLLGEDPLGGPLHAGVLLPLPLTDEAVDMVAARANLLADRYGVPFLLENLTHFLPGLPSEHGRDEIEFLNDLLDRSRCFLLLDLYNLHCNAVNQGFDCRDALARLRLDRVAQVHVAGGVNEQGLQLDVHSREVPEAVWELLDWVVDRCPNLGGIVYELMPQAMHMTGPRVAEQLARARAAWQRHLRRFPAARIAERAATPAFNIASNREQLRVAG